MIVQDIIKKKHKDILTDILIASQFISMLAYFNALRGFPLLVNCFPKDKGATLADAASLVES